MSANRPRPSDTGSSAWSWSGVVDALATAVAVLQPDLRVVYLNPAAEALLGCSRQRADGRPLSEFLRDGGELAQLAQRALEHGGPYARSELKAETQQRERIVDVRVDTMNNGESLLVEMLDAEPRLRLNRETTLLAQQSLSRSIGRQLAHEIRNPLAGLRGAAQLLQRQIAPELADYTQVIIDETMRLGALVDRVLGPERAAERTAVNLHRLLHHVYELLAADAGPAVTLIEDYDPSLPPLDLDSDQILQALLNIGRNGLQALDGRGTLRMRTRAETSYLLRGRRHALVARIDFEDDGAGIPEEIRDTLFYPLVTGRRDGTGIGLAVAQDLINRHDGLVQLHSVRAPTLFSVYLPVKR